MDNKKQYLWLLPLLLLFAFRKPTKATTTCVITPDEKNAKPIYGGDAILKLKPNTPIFATHSASSKVIANKSCYVERLGTDSSGSWIKVVNRTARGESDFVGWIIKGTIEKIL